MVDANLQRETILPSEKAFAYKMQLDALNHQGITSGQVGQKWSREKMADEALDSGRQIQRYIRLTYLIPELLSMVDDGKIAFNPAVELSYLDSYQQRAVLDAMVLNDCTPSHAQSIRLKKLAQEGLLDDQIVYAVLQPAGAAEIQAGGAAEILPLRLHRGTDASGHYQGPGTAEAAERTEPGRPLIRTDTAAIKQIAE